MKLFIDSIHLAEIKNAASMGSIQGVTTNSTLIAKAGKDQKSILAEIAEVFDGPIHADVVSLDSEGIIQEALVHAEIHPHIVSKVPMTAEGLKAVYQLEKRKIKTNMSLIFSANQALLAAEAGASSVSLFLDRLDNISFDGIELIQDIRTIYKIHSLNTQIIAANIRHPIHVTKAAMAGANVSTCPYSVLDRMIKHPLTDQEIERFLADWSTVTKGNSTNPLF